METMPLRQTSRPAVAAVALIVIAVGVVGGFLLVPWGFNFSDEPYQILNAMDWRDASVAPLSAWLSHWFGDACQWQWLAFRRLAWGLNLAAIAAGALFTWRRGLSATSTLCITAVAILGALCCGIWERFYGWDNFTNIATIALIIAFLGFFGPAAMGRALSARRVVVGSIVIGAILGVGTMFRLPSLGAWPIMAVCMAFCRGMSPKMRLSAIVALSLTMAMVVCAVGAGLYGSVGSFIDTVAGTAYGSHNSLYIVNRLLVGIASAVITGALAWAYYMLVKRNAAPRPCKVGAIVAGVAFFAFLGYNNIVDPKNSVGLLLALIAVPAIVAPGLRVVMLSLVAIAFTPCIGSIQGIDKFLVWATLPIVWMYARPSLTRPMLLAFIAIAGGWIGGNAVAMIKKGNKYITDTPLTETAVLHGKHIEGMRSGPYPAYLTEMVIKEFGGYVDDPQWHTWVIGGEPARYYYEFLFDRRNPWLLHAWGEASSNQDSTAVATLERDLTDHPNRHTAILFLPTQHEAGGSDPILMEEMLDSRMVLKARYPHFRVYVSRSDSTSSNDNPENNTTHS